MNHLPQEIKLFRDAKVRLKAGGFKDILANLAQALCSGQLPLDSLQARSLSSQSRNLLMKKTSSKRWSDVEKRFYLFLKLRHGNTLIRGMRGGMGEGVKGTRQDKILHSTAIERTNMDVPSPQALDQFQAKLDASFGVTKDSLQDGG